MVDNRIVHSTSYPTKTYSRWGHPPRRFPIVSCCKTVPSHNPFAQSRLSRGQAAACRRLQAIFSASRCASTAAISTTALAADTLVEAPNSSQSQPSPQLDGEMELLLRLLPPAVRAVLEVRPDIDQLVEVVLDLGRPPSARFPHGDVELSAQPLTCEALQQAVAQVGNFDSDNRAGIDSTLHRISCLRNRAGRIVGLTCRLGRSVPGAAALVRDMVLEGRSVLLLGRPGVGKTTALREVCRIAADEAQRRVVIVDTSNEIGGDGDVPHPSIGGARRMQVPRPDAQHAVMVEAVENHMPQVVVIDEISTLAECAAARTIAQRGVQLVATAHGSRLENVIKNPTLADLIGGVQSVTLGDEEARRRGVQKSILERAAPPTFDAAVEMEERGRWRVHLDVAAAVDTILAGGEAPGQVRFLDGSGRVTRATFLGTVRRTDDTTGAVTTSEWWADEAGEQEPLLWPTRQDTGRSAGPPTSPFPSSPFAPSPPSQPALSIPPSAPSPQASRQPASGGGAAAPPSASRGAAVAAAVAPLTAALRSSAAVRGAIHSGAPLSGTSAGSSSNTGSSSSAAGRAAAAPVSASVDTAAPLALPPRMRAYLVMSDEAAARVKAVLGLLQRQAYEAAVAAAAGAGGVGGGVAAAAAAAASGEVGPGTGVATHGTSSRRGSYDSLIEVVPELEMADMVIGTKSKLRNTPKIRNAARKCDLPIYALTSTSTSALVRNLCPLLGLDPVAVAEVVRAAGGEAGGPSRSPGNSVDEDLLASSEGEEELELEDTASSTTPSSAGGGGGGSGQRRSLELSAADDFAELLLTTVRELRYAPLDRSFTQHVIGCFVKEMTAATPAERAARSAASTPAATATTTASTDLFAAATSSTTAGSSSAPSSLQATPAAAPALTLRGAAPSPRRLTDHTTVRASSLAAVVWACSFVKHRRKFVEACRAELRLLAAACGERWTELSAQDVARAAAGFAALGVTPPSGAWLEGLAQAADAALGRQQRQRHQEEQGGRAGESHEPAGVVVNTAEEGAAAGAGGSVGRQAGGVLSADEAARLQLALAELEVLWRAEMERQRCRGAGGAAS